MLRGLYISLLFVVLSYLPLAAQEVLVGATDTATYMPMLEGRRVAVLANHTAMYSAEEHLVDMLHRGGVNLVGIFAPEHGFRGAVEAGAKVEDGVDAKTVCIVHGCRIQNGFDGLESRRDRKTCLFG